MNVKDNYKEREKIINVNSKKIFLKKISLHDVNENYFSWFKDEKIKKFIYKKIKTINHLKKDVKFHLNKKNSFFFGIFVKKDKIHIGNIKFDPINKYRNFFWLGILIGNKLYRGKGIGKNVINKSIIWMFKEKKIHSIFLVVKKNNKMAIQLYKNCKFKILKTLNGTNEYLMFRKNPRITLNQIRRINNFKEVYEK